MVGLGPFAGVVSTGGGAILCIRFGILPEVCPVLASQALYFLESNTRSATIVGIVAAIDVVSKQLRFALIGRRGKRV